MQFVKLTTRIAKVWRKYVAFVQYVEVDQLHVCFAIKQLQVFI